MKINKEWHKMHKMQKNTTIKQRIDWHFRTSKKLPM